MKRQLLAAAGLAIAATAISAPVQAGPFDKLKKKVEKVQKKVKEVEQAARQVEGAVDAVKDGRAADVAAEAAIQAATGGARTRLGSPLGGVRAAGSERGGVMQYAGQRRPDTAKAPAHAGVASAVPANFVGQINCANVGLGNAFVGQGGKYTFSKGIKTEERGGLVDRVNVQPTNGCLYGGLGVGDVLYVEVDKKLYDEYNHAIQCVSYDGSEQLDNTNGPRWNNYTGKDVMLHTGNSLGYTPTATGSNGQRSDAYKAYLDERGRRMMTFNFEGIHSDKSGTDFFCQWFNDKTGKSAVAFAFRRGPQG